MTKEEFIKRVNDRLEELKTEYEKVILRLNNISMV